jgi:hypothetical protein
VVSSSAATVAGRANTATVATSSAGTGSVTAFGVTAMALGVAFDADCDQGGGFTEFYADDPRIRPLLHAGAPVLY